MNFLSGSFGKTLVTASTILFCALLSFSGLTHIFNPGTFALAIGRYSIVSPMTGALLALVLPALQITTAVMLLLRDYQFLGAMSAMIQFFVYSLAQGYVIASGLTIDCGCFGSLSRVISIETFLLVASLFVLAVIHVVMLQIGSQNG